MFELIICEDNPELLNLYTIIVKKYIAQNNQLPLRLSLATTNPNTVEKRLNSRHYSKSIFLLDIEFANSKIRGLDLATTIRQVDPKANIIFITTHEEFEPLTFERKINPVDSIYKEIGLAAIQVRLFKDLNQIFNQDQQPSPETTFHYQLGMRHYELPLRQVNYFEATSATSKISLHTMHEITELRGSLANIAHQYPELTSINANLLINAANIAKIDENNHTIQFRDGMIVAVMLTKREQQLLQSFLQKTNA